MSKDSGWFMRPRFRGPGTTATPVELELTAQKSGLVHKLLEIVKPDRIVEGSPEAVHTWLQETLKYFAFRLCQDAREEREYHTLLFILKFRREIAADLQRQWQVKENTNRRFDTNQTSSIERVRQWQVDQNRNFGITRQEDPFIEFPQGAWRRDLEFVIDSPAYTWLASRLTSYSYLSIPEEDVMTHIGQTIYDSLLGDRWIGKNELRLDHTMSFEVDLDINKFLNNHDFGTTQKTMAILHTFLALTSDGEHVQALTCSQYLQQVWPQSGNMFLGLITTLAREGLVSLHISGCVIDGWLLDTKMIFTITGNFHSIIELGQQLAWIGSVLQPSTAEGKVQYCVPTIWELQIDSSAHLSTEKICRWKIDFIIFDATKKDSNADCWRDLFRYPVVARGFPIARRDSDVGGLEIGLGTMLSLCHAHHVSEFGDKILIKGYSAMFWLSKHQPGSSVWHFSGHINGPYISCSEIANACEDKTLSVHEILQDRHFVGWCSKVTYNAGALDSCYAIQTSGLSQAQYAGVLFETNIRRPVRYLNEDICTLDKGKNKWRTPNQSYHERLEWIHKRPVVLWDTEHRKGWLLNGTSALLHLILASIEDRGGPFDSTYCLRREDIRQYSKQPENAAARLLLDERNLQLPIRKHGEEIVCLRQRVEDICLLLNLMMEIQISKIRSNKTVTKALDGWDFMDMADITHDPLHAKTFELDKDCSGWMQLLQDTYSVTLFGENFGEILSPLNSSLCHRWSILPPQNCYLAASINDLDLVSGAYGGNKKVVPRKLTENTLWEMKVDKFDNCECLENCPEHSNLVQVLVPRSRVKDDSATKSPLCIGPSEGAVIFGEVDGIAWVQSGYSPLSETRPLKRQRYENDSELQDSGIGESISNPTSTQKSESPKGDEYLVAIVCALRKELRAVRLLFDQTYEDPAFDKHDPHHYAFGRIHSHNVVAACLPGIYGTCSATRVASELKRSFPMVRFCLLVGIGAGVPSEKNDIRLGDIVVSYPEGDHSGMIKYDFEKLMQSGETKRLGTFIQPPRELISVLGILDTGPMEYTEPLREYLKVIVDAEDDYRYPGEELDRLFASDSPHLLGMDSCDSCTGLQQRKSQKLRRSQQPRIHYGLIASGDKVVKDAHLRDKLGSEYNALCIEMEAAGVANVLPCLVIRGICDYADSHKHDIWQEYASATAAAYAKLLLGKARIV